jgi:hypothetical protein
LFTPTTLIIPQSFSAFFLVSLYCTSIPLSVSPKLNELPKSRIPPSFNSLPESNLIDGAGTIVNEKY